MERLLWRLHRHFSGTLPAVITLSTLRVSEHAPSITCISKGCPAKECAPQQFRSIPQGNDGNLPEAMATEAG
jgi:hypothetical protein